MEQTITVKLPAALYDLSVGLVEAGLFSDLEDVVKTGIRNIPRRAPLYRWLRFYKHLILNGLRALFALQFDGFMAYEQQVTRDALAYAWKIPTSHPS